MSVCVGIPTCLDTRGRWRAGRDYLYCDRAYADAVSDAGGVPLHLPPPPRDAAPDAHARALLARIDALLVPGGDDFAPPADRVYPAEVAFEPVPSAQLAFDRALLAAALERGTPVLGICYGMQLIALHHGGALHYDLATERPGSAAHQLDEHDPVAGRHAVVAAPGSRLAACIGQRASVNSLHHQAVASPGRGLRAVAHGEDGVIEAIEAEAPDRFCIGVQWHPEKLSGDARVALVRALVEHARTPR